MKYIFSGIIVSVLITAFAYLFGVFIFWDFWPDNPEEQGSALFFLRFIFGAFFVLGIMAAIGTDKE